MLLQRKIGRRAKAKLKHFNWPESLSVATARLRGGAFFSRRQSVRDARRSHLAAKSSTLLEDPSRLEDNQWAARGV